MAKMTDGLGGPGGFGEGVFSTATKATGSNDDGSVYVDVSSVFGATGMEFFGNNYSGLYINSNGLISFDAANSTYAGNSISDLTGPSIAPFWADHNIDNGGEIYWDLDPSTGKVTITWDDVAPYSGGGKNSYQVVLTNKGNGDFDIEITYETVDWANGGGKSAIAGITDGGSNSFTFEGSGNEKALKKFDKQNFGEDDNGHEEHGNGHGHGNEKGVFETSVTNGLPDYTDGSVDGSAGNDSFVLSILDLEGDAITTAADVVLAGGGDDYVDANAGDDTIDGGAGSDTLLGGEGADEIYGDGENGESTGPTTQTVSINQNNYTDNSSGFTVSARNVVNGQHTAASTANVTTAMGGFGASGAISDSDSGIQAQTGFDLASGLSEELIIDFDEDVDSASFSFFALYSASYGEQAQWTIYQDGTQVAQSTFTEIGAGSGSGTIDLSGYGAFDRIVFSSLTQTDGSDGSDFFIADVTFTRTITGSENDDSIDGGDGTDAIFGGQGADTVLGGSGADTISGDAGDDSIDAGTDDDVVSGGEGDDTIFGGLGGDTLIGGLGDDLIDGGEGDDLLRTGLGQDTLLGGEGDDTLKNSAGDDSLVGGVGNDSIVATIGDDTLEGGDGNDTLIGGIDDDSIDGGAGDDSITGDFEAGGLAQPNELFAYEYYELDGQGPITSLADAGFTTGQDNDNPPDGQGAVDTLDTNAIDAQHGGDANTYAVKLVTTLTVTSAGNYDFGLTSDDGAQLYVDGVLVSDNDGAHTASTVSGTTSLTSGEHLVEIIYFDDTGSETLSVTLTGPDTGGTPVALESAAIGNSFDDIILGGSGSDTIDGGLGADSMSGGDDADTFRISDAFGNDTIVGGEGGVDEDTIDLSGLSGPVTVTYNGNEAGTITDGSDTISFSEIENLILTEKSDVIDASADTLGVNVDAGGGDDTITGGDGDDSITGGDGVDTFVYQPGDGHDTITDFNTGNDGTISDGDGSNNDYIDLSGYYDHISELYADQADDGVLNQSNATDSRGYNTDYSDNNQFGSGSLRMQGASADDSSFTQENTNVVCFNRGTMIRTPRGEVPVEALRVGDLVSTMDNGPQPIRWISHTDLDQAALVRNPKIRPVLIGKGVLGAARDLLVSPQHGVLLGDAHLARATHLARSLQGVRIAHGKQQVSYYHLMFDSHQIVFGEGIPSESFYPGKMALLSLSAGAKLSLMAAFSGTSLLSGTTFSAHRYGAPARPFLRAKEIPTLCSALDLRRRQGGLILS